MSIGVLLVDDQHLVREGIKSLLSLSNKVTVVGEAVDGEQAIFEAQKEQVQVILMDIRMPKCDGIQALQKIREKGIQTPVLMLTTFDDHQLLLDAVKTGAQGYLLKDVSLETLVGGIEKVYEGQTLIQPAITQNVLAGLRNTSYKFETNELTEPLTDKEVEILRLLASGCSNKEIAQLVFKSEGSVKNQVSNVLAKLGVRDRTRAVLKAIDLKLI
jgi:DNA-binding NarL/FixJ family response regulator